MLLFITTFLLAGIQVYSMTYDIKASLTYNLYFIKKLLITEKVLHQVSSLYNNKSSLMETN